MTLRDGKFTAAALGMSETQLHRLAHDGLISCVQLGPKLRRWTDEQIAEIVARHTQPARMPVRAVVPVTPMRTRQARGPQRRAS